MTESGCISGNRLRIAFAHIPGEGWSAGTYYLKNLFYALRALPNEVQPELVLLVPENSTPESYSELAPFIDKLLERPGIDRKSFFNRLVSSIGIKVGLKNPVSAFLQRNGVDVFFALGPPPPNFFLPYLCWIPDFQHLHYHEFFSELEIESRNRSFMCSVERATHIILSSNSALEDYNKFAPKAEKKARVLSFVAQVPDDIYQQDPEGICKKYNIPRRYILLPNQFWKHKNHGTVVRALQIALNEEPELTVVCTGNTNEFRDLSYLSKLLCLISNTGVRERFVILGLVPRQDLFFLMRQSIAVLQPSLFEGWNTIIEEVKSLGKKLLVSDIPVHREQNASSVVYFKPTDAKSLAMSLIDIFANGRPGPDPELEKAAKESLMARTEQYGKRFFEIAQETVRK